jgi:hypothetical protein
LSAEESADSSLAFLVRFTLESLLLAAVFAVSLSFLPDFFAFSALNSRTAEHFLQTLNFLSPSIFAPSLVALLQEGQISWTLLMSILPSIFLMPPWSWADFGFLC